MSGRRVKAINRLCKDEKSKQILAKALNIDSELKNFEGKIRKVYRKDKKRLQEILTSC